MAGRKHRRRADIAEGKITRRSPHICHLCDITATSADHLALHMAGTHHHNLSVVARFVQHKQVQGGCTSCWEQIHAPSCACKAAPPQLHLLGEVLGCQPSLQQQASFDRIKSFVCVHPHAHSVHRPLTPEASSCGSGGPGGPLKPAQAP